MTDNKLTRVDAQSPVSAQTSTQQQPTPSAHQQAFLNPTLPPGYNYYYPGGVLPAAAAAAGGYQYTPTMFPVPNVTNATHGSASASGAQFQKPGAYGSHGYGTGAQSQDFSKTYVGSTQSQNKVGGGSVTATSSASDLTGGSTYGKAHTQSFDKAGFHGGTPPPFNLPMASGTQGGPMGGPAAAYGTPYVPVMPHMHHPIQPDASGNGGRSAGQASVQAKAASAKNYSTTYWGTN